MTNHTAADTAALSSAMSTAAQAGLAGDWDDRRGPGGGATRSTVLALVAVCVRSVVGTRPSCRCDLALTRGTTRSSGPLFLAILSDSSAEGSASSSCESGAVPRVVAPGRCRTLACTCWSSSTRWKRGVVPGRRKGRLRARGHVAWPGAPRGRLARYVPTRAPTRLSSPT